MKNLSSFGLWGHATFGPLAAVVAGVAGSVIGKAIGPKAPKAPVAASVPPPPRPPQPMGSTSSSFFGPTTGTQGGTFVTGSAGKPNLGGGGGGKTLLGG